MPLNPRPPFYLLSVAANAERHKIASGEPWLLLMDLVWPGDAQPGVTQQHLRLARNTDTVTFDAGDGSGPQDYQPFNFTVGDLNTSSNGSVPEMTLSVSNVMRVVQTLVEQYAGVVGAKLYLYVLNTANPQGEPDLMLQFSVKQTVCDAKAVQFKLGAPSPLRRLFPIHMYRPNYCIWQYNSPAMQAANDPRGKQCGYTGALTGCTHTLDGTNGCIAHANQERFGGFPGIDTSGYQAASAS